MVGAGLKGASAVVGLIPGGKVVSKVAVVGANVAVAGANIAHDRGAF